MLFGMVAFIARVFEHDQHMMTSFLSLPLALVGVLMVLYGVGEWGRWAYLLVFLSIPATFIGYCILFPHSGKEAHTIRDYGCGGASHTFWRPRVL